MSYGKIVNQDNPKERKPFQQLNAREKSKKKNLDDFKKTNKNDKESLKFTINGDMTIDNFIKWAEEAKKDGWKSVEINGVIQYIK